MPDKPLKVLTYAASASLAAVALVYFFNPNQFIDGDSSTSSASTRKKGIVGLTNPANDCFINSVLQALAGLGDLRLYLIREVHRRELDDASIYTSLPEEYNQRKDSDLAKLVTLQRAQVTQGLKSILDQLNERPIYKKTISAQSFVAVLEHAFGTRISRAQQDAQELLQIVAERLSEEYHAGKQARRRYKEGLRKILRRASESLSPEDAQGPGRDSSDVSTVVSELIEPICAADESTTEDEGGFPLEGQTEARVECQHCHFIPKSTPTSFVMLNLMVPQKGSTTLNECFDAHFKTEYIDDYICDRCRLQHAVETLEEEVTYAKSKEQKDRIHFKLDRVRKALEADPEKAPERVQLPDIKHAPKRKVARHVQITEFPKILVIHLSRSMFDPGSYSQKNSAKLTFPERLPIGGILNRRKYKLLGLITHNGTHDSGHYETFRRQHLYPPTSRPHVKKSVGPYSASATPVVSNVPSPQLSGNLTTTPDGKANGQLSGHLLERSALPDNQSPAASSDSLSSTSTRPTSGSAAGGEESRPSQEAKGPSVAHQAEEPTSVLSPPLEPKPDTSAFGRYSASLDLTRFKRKKRKSSDRWWRISDDKIRECNTVDVLAMQRDVYMLFYEMVKDDPTEP
ncbi:MAG: hypothetical protein L6R39_005371 [Caloplaca ligustica]|nr:MAG: hypothetical protein L6R39_005371 [Caloplaca ligustica]